MIKWLKKNNNYKLIIGLLLSFLVSVSAVYAYFVGAGNELSYDPSNTWLTATDVQGALDELYFSDCPIGYNCRNMPLPSFITDNAVMDNISSTYVTSSTGINFLHISSSTNGQGIYIRAGTENDDYPIYYYRGDVNNNNVLFANICWKIVRTTENGGIKLIYNGLPTSGSCLATTGTDTQLSYGFAEFNSGWSSPAEAGYMYGSIYTTSTMESASLATPYKYGNRFSYSGGTYTLVDTITSTGSWATDYNTLNNNHYTCFNDTGVCSSLYYIYYTNAWKVYYITLTGGKNVETALDEMLSNITDSSVKTIIDDWYSANLTNYTSYLEDTIWCNDREIYRLGGWNPNGGTLINSELQWKDNIGDSAPLPRLVCNRANDIFTVSSANGNGKLTYPVGMLTVDEVWLAGGMTSTNKNYYLYSGADYWTISPKDFVFYSHIWIVNYEGKIDDNQINSLDGVRPSIVLRLGVTWTGDGTANNPYTVSWN